MLSAFRLRISPSSVLNIARAEAVRISIYEEEAASEHRGECGIPLSELSIEPGQFTLGFFSFSVCLRTR